MSSIIVSLQGEDSKPLILSDSDEREGRGGLYNAIITTFDERCPMMIKDHQIRY
jgi:hypothetical protein